MELLPARLHAYRETISVQGRALARLAATAWDEPVPTCPGWDVGTVLAHTGGAHRWATANLTSGERVRLSTTSPPPAGRQGVTGWFDEGLAALLDAAAEIDPETEVWTFAASGERRGGWWLRRMALETTLHRMDAEEARVAAGTEDEAPPPDPELGADGIEEYLLDFLPRLPAETWDGWKGTLHLHATDADAEWLLDLGDMTVPAQRGHGKADTAVRGPAADLLLWLWNRRGAEGLVVFGDPTPVGRWRQICM